MNTTRVRNVPLLVLVALLIVTVLACEIGGGLSKPTITITAPTSAAEFEEGDQVTVLSSASDAKGVTRVELYVDGGLYRTDSSPSAEGEKALAMAQTWVAAEPGLHTISVIAYNVDGAASDPWAVTVKVVEEGAGVTAPTPTSTGGVIPAATNTPAPPPEATATTAPPPSPTDTVPPPPTDTPEPEPADLYISEIRVVPESPQQGSPATVGVRIHNGGAVEASGFRVIWRSAGPTIGCQWDADPIAPGAARWYQCEYTYRGWANYTTTGVVDVDNTVVESDETNNELVLMVNVRAAAARPDLYISEIRLVPESPQQGSPCTVGVRIHNGGTAEASGFKVIWRSAGSTVGCQWDADPIAPGEARWYQCEYTYGGWNPNYTTTGVVDVDNTVVESDETNNELVKMVNVRPS